MNRCDGKRKQFGLPEPPIQTAVPLLQVSEAQLPALPSERANVPSRESSRISPSRHRRAPESVATNASIRG